MQIRAVLSRLRFRTLRRRFLAAMIAISLPPLFILGYMSFNIAKQTLMETNTRVFEDHLKTSSEVADMLFRNLITLNRSIVVNEEIRQALIYSNSKELSSRTDLEASAANRLQKAISNNQFDTRYISSICLLNNDFNTICSGRSDDAGIYERVAKKELIEQSDWYRQAVAAQGRVVFVGYDVFGQNNDVFTTVKLFRNAATASGEPTACSL
ncbi:hypothetical protein LJK88_24735 [Paenibacillus sp. P26]|nr:hypothetical protein LJK88_24735 [Paenibacillus sp. P26]UUZ95332.1 hypothetical protein LJK87_13190 [Paenibacillus sp. P25]